jgi:hypothetical protein
MTVRMVRMKLAKLRKETETANRESGMPREDVRKPNIASETQNTGFCSSNKEGSDESKGKQIRDK